MIIEGLPESFAGQMEVNATVFRDPVATNKAE